MSLILHCGSGRGISNQTWSPASNPSDGYTSSTTSRMKATRTTTITRGDGQLVSQVVFKDWGASTIHIEGSGEVDFDSDMKDEYQHKEQAADRDAESLAYASGSGVTMKASDMLVKSGKMGWYGKPRVFVGPDGRQYKWIIKSTKPQLVTNDAHETLVATFHRYHSGIIGTARQASLEIFSPAAENTAMTDMILTTFIFVEKKRRDAEAAAAAAGSS